MCLIGLALGQRPDLPLVIAANRDEFLQRPAAALDWWRALPTEAPLLGGRDLQAGGTWMGLGTNGRVAMLTNVRDPARQRSAAPSRGAIVPAWLATQADTPTFWRDTVLLGHNPFNVLAGDLTQGRWWWADDRADTPHMLEPGLYGLSNARLDTPWPKVERLKRALAQAVDAASSMAQLEAQLFAALVDRSPVPDEALPDTGIGLERERWLAPAFIRSPDARYGTRCSTLLIAERRADGLSVHMIERQFDAAGRPISQRHARLERWPLSSDETPPVCDEPLSAA
ncbi:MAG: NRDE family protein [Pseudomonadota bacterium]